MRIFLIGPRKAEQEDTDLLKAMGYQPRTLTDAENQVLAYSDAMLTHMGKRVITNEMMQACFVVLDHDLPKKARYGLIAHAEMIGAIIIDRKDLPVFAPAYRGDVPFYNKYHGRCLYQDTCDVTRWQRLAGFVSDTLKKFSDRLKKMEHRLNRYLGWMKNPNTRRPVHTPPRKYYELPEQVTKTGS